MMTRVGGVFLQQSMAIPLVFCIQISGTSLAVAAGSLAPGTPFGGTGPILNSLGSQPPLVELVLAPPDGAVTLAEDLANDTNLVLGTELDAVSQLLGGSSLTGVGTTGLVGTTSPGGVATPIGQGPVAEILLAPLRGVVRAASDGVGVVTDVTQAELDGLNRLAGGPGVAGGSAFAQSVIPGVPVGTLGGGSPILALILAPIRNTITIGNAALGLASDLIGAVVAIPGTGGTGGAGGFVTTLTGGLSDFVGTLGAVAQNDFSLVSRLLGGGLLGGGTGFSSTPYTVTANTTVPAVTTNTTVPAATALRTTSGTGILQLVMRLPAATGVAVSDLAGTAARVTRTLVGSVVKATGELVGAPAPTAERTAQFAVSDPSESDPPESRVGEAVTTLATGLGTAVRETGAGVTKAATDFRRTLRGTDVQPEALVQASGGNGTTVNGVLANASTTGTQTTNLTATNRKVAAPDRTGLATRKVGAHRR